MEETPGDTPDPFVVPVTQWSPPAPGRNRRAIVILSVVVTVALLIGGGAAVALVHNKSHPVKVAETRGSAPSAVITKVTNVPVATLNQIGQGTIIAAPKPITGAPLVAAGKPEMLFIGAEFCPYCASERWSMAIALSRFGTLSDVKYTASSPDDVFPNTASLDFIDTKFASKYLTFTPIENEDRNHKLLQPLTKAQNALWNHYTDDRPGFPFIDFGNAYIVLGPTLDPSVLAGLTRAQIASRLADPNDPVARAVDGAANGITAAICGMTDNQPATVCSSPVISGLLTQIGGTSPASVDSQA